MYASRHRVCVERVAAVHCVSGAVGGRRGGGRGTGRAGMRAKTGTGTRATQYTYGNASRATLEGLLTRRCCCPAVVAPQARDSRTKAIIARARGASIPDVENMAVPGFGQLGLSRRFLQLRPCLRLPQISASLSRLERGRAGPRAGGRRPPAARALRGEKTGRREGGAKSIYIVQIRPDSSKVHAHVNVVARARTHTAHSPCT